jgi:ferredoxin-NADP reductase
VQFLPVGTGGAQIVREYTLVPSHKDPQYGSTVPEYIMSSYETDALSKGERIQLNQMYRYYPQRFDDKPNNP